MNGMVEADELYFAYGSNLNIPELTAACSRDGIPSEGICLVGPAYLPDMELVFNYRSVSRGGGALNLRVLPDSTVSGYLLHLSPAVWQLVDRKEGHPKYYRRTPVEVMAERSVPRQAIAYIVVPERVGSFVPPTPEYLSICEEGRKQLGLETHSLLLASKGAEPAPV